MRRPALSLLLSWLCLTASGCSRDTGTSRPIAPPPATASAEEPVLNVYSWPDYMAPGILDRFERETGIHITYKTYTSDGELETKLLIGHSNFDVVVPSSPYFERQMHAGTYLKLDKSALTNYRNLDKEVLAQLADYDPNNQYAVPFMRTTVGLLYDVDKIRERLGSDIPASWALLFDPAVAAKLQDCGIGFADLPVETFTAVLQYLGQNPKDMSPKQVAQAALVLRNIRRYVRNSKKAFVLHADELASGDFCVALTWGGDAVLARERTKTRGKPLDLEFITPLEGGQRWFDMMAIPVDAPHPRNAHRWLNYLMQPDVIAELSNYLRYANGNTASTPLLDDSLKFDRAVYPDADAQRHLINAISPSAQLSLQISHEWVRFRAGS